MKNSLIYLFLYFLTITTISYAACPYSGAPINWIMRYCGFIVESDDEIAIQDSACYKSAEHDLSVKDECKIKKKYKTMFCEKYIRTSKKFKNLADCLNDNKVEAFYAGG